MIFEHALVLSAYLFSIGIYELIMSKNMVRALMCLELMLNVVNINLEIFFSIFVIAIIEPTIVFSIYGNKKSTCINASVGIS
ncbi:NAD(P)H-quinone oxidoreductase subunit 4L, chloroplastic [Glycine soja]|uniref:NAD(P)H-quinone oxidoreductase subunit 4L, chloroplastic n=1 Tax=Glycine soja TaxID=3848 RepID=A0A445JQ91_GLYSO|nr:NAD(P)H-quinone oxidoreductase subunit 4L, chloroplastic [Glycine soja]